MRPSECRQRVAILRLSNAELARRAQLDENTVGKCLAETSDSRRSTLEKIESALTEAELETLAVLASRHPSEALQAATVALCPEAAERKAAA